MVSSTALSNTPADLSTRAPELSFDTIYEFFGAQPFNVATAAPATPAATVGRWRVDGLEFTEYSAAVAAFNANGSGDVDSDEEAAAALDASGRH
jgi:hypothetical protein